MGDLYNVTGLGHWKILCITKWNVRMVVNYSKWDVVGNGQDVFCMHSRGIC
jgi:hypothetical protein